MKANLKGLGGIKGLFLLHGEKLLIGAVGICTLLIVYYSLQLDRLDSKYQADNLRAQISQTEGVVRDFSWEKALADNPAEVRVAKELGKGAAPEVDPDKYGFSGHRPDHHQINDAAYRSSPAWGCRPTGNWRLGTAAVHRRSSAQGAESEAR